MADLPPFLPRALHGGPSSTVFTGLDFSVNTNPYGPDPALLAAVQRADHLHYPDPTYLAVRQRLASWHGVKPDQVALGVGVSDLLYRLARAFLPAGEVLLSLHAPFGELSRAAQLQRAEIQVVEELPARLPARTRLVYVGQPHNPTGRSLSVAELGELVRLCSAARALLLLDLAYAPFVAPLVAVPALFHPAAIALYSPGKAHALVGARPAYALASAAVVALLDNLAPAWHLPAGTAALLAALPDAQAFLHQSLPRVGQQARALAQALSAFGEVEHHGTPYLTLEVGRAAPVARELLALGIKVRDCTSYGLPSRVRISTRQPEENAGLLAALEEVKLWA